MTVKPLSQPSQTSEDTFSIRVTAELTGISAHKLRMWQRRYGFPMPLRTSGGARRYREEDISTLKIIASALEQGFRAGEVVGKAPEDLQRLLTKRAVVPATFGAPPGLSETLQFIETDKIERVREQIRQAAAALGAKHFVTDFAHPLAVAMGERWRQGSLSIQQEHFASTMLATQLRVLLNAYDGLAGKPRVLLTTLEDERHGLALEMVALYLALNGAAPKLLGTHTPVPDIVMAATRLSIDAVGISVSAAADRESATTLLGKLSRRLPATIQLWVGGGGADDVELPRRAKSITTWEACDECLASWRSGGR